MITQVFFSSEFCDNQQVEKQTDVQLNCADLSNQKAKTQGKCLSMCKVLRRHWAE